MNEEGNIMDFDDTTVNTVVDDEVARLLHIIENLTNQITESNLAINTMTAELGMMREENLYNTRNAQRYKNIAECQRGILRDAFRAMTRQQFEDLPQVIENRILTAETRGREEGYEEGRRRGATEGMMMIMNRQRDVDNAHNNDAQRMRVLSR